MSEATILLGGDIILNNLILILGVYTQLFSESKNRLATSLNDVVVDIDTQSIYLDKLQQASLQATRGQIDQDLIHSDPDLYRNLIAQ